MEASVVVTEPDRLEAAAGLVRDVVQSVDDACSRFRPDSELMRLRALPETGTGVGPMLALLVEKALSAAEWTDGDVDPTLGVALVALGYDRDLYSIGWETIDSGGSDPAAGGNWRDSAHKDSARNPVPGWQRVRLEGRRLHVPPDLLLDLGATAKAVAADLAAERVAHALGCGVLVALGGDLATAGPGPHGADGAAWGILVQDTGADPAQDVDLVPGFAMATSSTQKRRWKHAGREVHHILDPRFGLPVRNTWRSATVAASSCLRANALSTAAIVRGHAAVGWLDRMGVAARLVDAAGNVVTTGGWPEAPHAIGEEVRQNG